MKSIDLLNKKASLWATKNFFQIGIFNLVIIFLFLLRSAGYFNPYFPISVNFIITVGLGLAILLFKAGSRAIFVVSLLFWIFAAMLRALNLDVWAERTAVYTYQSLVIGLILLIVETFYKPGNPKE